MRSVYALIPAALLAGTVLSASADAKSRRVEQLEVHAQRVLAQQKYFKTNIASTKRKLAAKARSGGTAKLAGAKSRKLAVAKKLAAPEAQAVAPKLKLAGAKPLAAPKLKLAGAKPLAAPKLKLASAKPRKLATIKNHKSARLAPAKKTVVMALAQDIAPAPKRVSVASMSLTKTLPREPEKPVGKPVAVAPGPVRKSEPMKINETSGNYVADIIREMAPGYGVPTWFALRIANVESGYNPYARGRAGEIGVYQLKCQTARGMGFEGDCAALTDARTNVRWGLKHLSLAIASSGGNLRLAASKHNGGLARKSLVQSYIAKVF
jgi:soluble lytic murein transglycosylase-like protein